MVWEFGVNFCVILGLVIVKVGDFVVLLINFEEWDVFFIDEIYCFNLVVEEVFYFVMEDYQFDFIIGEGLVVWFVKIDLVKFILVVVMICFGLLMILLCDCFGILVWFEFYIVFEFEYIVKCGVLIFGIGMVEDGVYEIVKWFCGILWIVGRLFCCVCDFVVFEGVERVDCVFVDKVLC